MLFLMYSTVRLIGRIRELTRQGKRA